MSDPFRSELEAAHARIEQLEAEHQARVAELERENARLRERLVDTGRKNQATGRTFIVLAMVVLGVSLLIGIFYARVAAGPPPSREPPLASVVVVPNPTARDSDFDRSAVAVAFQHVPIADCITTTGRGEVGHVTVTIAPSGEVTSALVDQGALVDTAAGRCVEQRYREVRVPPFSGPARKVGTTFTVP